jgi:hypothetical protein
VGSKIIRVRELPWTHTRPAAFFEQSAPELPTGGSGEAIAPFTIGATWFFRPSALRAKKAAGQLLTGSLIFFYFIYDILFLTKSYTLYILVPRVVRAQSCAGM